MTLTAKQEQFAQCVAGGMTQSDAYRAACDVRPDTKPESIHVNASQMMADAKVALRVKALRDALAEQALWSRMDSVRTLAEIANGQCEGAKASDRVSAVKALNTMQGFDAASKVDHSSTDGTMSPTRIELVAPQKADDNATS